MSEIARETVRAYVFYILAIDFFQAGKENDQKPGNMILFFIHKGKSGITIVSKVSFQNQRILEKLFTCLVISLLPTIVAL